MDKGWVTYRVGTNLREAQERDERKGGGEENGGLKLSPCLPIFNKDFYTYTIRLFCPVVSFWFLNISSTSLLLPTVGLWIEQ